MEFHAFHGVYEFEKKDGNKFLVDVAVSYPIEQIDLDDDLGRTVNYEEIYQLTKSVMANPSNLIEHVAMNIAHKIRGAFEGVDKVSVQLSKINPPLAGTCERATVKVEI